MFAVRFGSPGSDLASTLPRRHSAELDGLYWHRIVVADEYDVSVGLHSQDPIAWA